MITTSRRFLILSKSFTAAISAFRLSLTIYQLHSPLPGCSNFVNAAPTNLFQNRVVAHADSATKGMQSNRTYPLEFCLPPDIHNVFVASDLVYCSLDRVDFFPFYQCNEHSIRDLVECERSC